MIVFHEENFIINSKGFEDYKVHDDRNFSFYFGNYEVKVMCKDKLALDALIAFGNKCRYIEDESITISLKSLREFIYVEVI